MKQRKAEISKKQACTKNRMCINETHTSPLSGQSILTRGVPHRKRTVIVENDALVAEHFRQVCEQTGFDVVGIACDSKSALKKISTQNPELVLMDVIFEGETSGIDLAAEARKRHPRLRVIFIAGSSEHRNSTHMPSGKLSELLIKPVEPDRLAAACL